MDALDELFDSPAPVAPTIKMMPRQLLYYCATGDHRRCHGFGWVNTDEYKTGTNAGTPLHVRCSCECHRDQYDI
jgi:hypothetical protein